MSVALADIGNSRIKWGVIGESGVEQTRALMRTSAVEAEFAPILHALPATLERLIATNVAGLAVGDAFRAAVLERFNVNVEFVSTQAQCGPLKIAYDDPSALGVDRWAAMLAAVASGAQPLLVVDAGTACTIDAIDADGQHLGGMILPGAHLMQQLLLSRTADIRFRRESLPDPATEFEFFAATTPLAVQNGCLQAIVGAVMRSYATLAKEYPEVQLWITGGDAPSVLPHLSVGAELRPALVLEGLSAWVSLERRE